MEIRRARRSDIDSIMPIYEAAKAFMRACGNSSQWADGYPDRATILADIDTGYCHIGIDNKGNIAMVFAFIIGEDPTYATIEDGQWPDNRPYGTIHRMASSGAHSGMLLACTEYCLGKIDTLRLDTHADNSHAEGRPHRRLCPLRHHNMPRRHPPHRLSTLPSK